MPEDRLYDDTDRELVENAWRSTSAVRLDGIEMMVSDAMRAADVLDALTAPDSPLLARHRAQVAKEIAQAIEATADAYNQRIADAASVPNRGRDGMVAHGIRRAARIAREVGGTTGEGGNDG